MQVSLFIDYDNLVGLQKRAGILSVVTSALMATAYKTTASSGRCDVRIYGGWYEGANLTPLAQKVIAEIQSDFPAVIRGKSVTGNHCTFSVQAELACSLSEEPSHHLLDTFRKKKAPSNLRCSDPSGLGCKQAACPLKHFSTLFDTERCPASGCGIELKDVLYRNEQKLVDTMLTCDMIHAAGQRRDLLIVVSGDDDILPAIRTATLRGTPVVRLHTKQYQQPTVFPQGGAPLVEQCLERMHTDAFKRIVTTFADPQTPLLIERDRTLVQVNGNLIEVTLKQRSGEIFVIDAGNEMPANQWILTRLAQLPLLADRLLATIPATRPFVTPEAHLLQSLEVRPGEEPEHVPEALTATLAALDRRSPLETTVLYVTSDAGEGKTCLINEMARLQADRFKARTSDWLLLPIPLGGRTFLRFDDITVGALQNRYRFPFLYYDAFLELVRLGVLIPAFDGFEEMFVETSTGEALSAMGILVGSLHSAGAVVIAARKAYFEFQNLKLQARLYDTISGYAVGFGKLSLDRWKKEQFVNYCGQRGVPVPERLYEKVVTRLDPEHPLLTRPVLVRRLVDIADGSTSLDAFLTVLKSSGGNFFSVFVRGIVEREAHDKWIERGEVAQPLLSVEEHCELLSLVALEMWHARVDFLKTESLEFVTDYFSETKRRGSGATAQIRERIKGHALLIASPNVHGAVEFDHDEFKQFFLGEAVAKLCLDPQGATRADILNALRRGILPSQAFTALVQAIKRETGSRQRQVAASLAEIALLDGQTSFTHENCAVLIIAILSSTDDTDVVLRRISFPANILRDAKLSRVFFEDCFFAPSSLENTTLRNCQFMRCQFARLEFFESTSVENVTMTDSPVDALYDMGRGINYFEPAAVKSHVQQLGFLLPEMPVELPLQPAEPTEREDALVQFEKLLRYFMRSTHISESVVRVKLGGRGNAFISDVIPVLLSHGILVEVENRGGDLQQRFKLGRPMEALTRALDNSAGSLNRFVALATQPTNPSPRQSN